MRGSAFIEGIRSFRLFAANESEAMQIAHLLADAVEEADEASRALVESEAWMLVDDWWDTSGADAHVREHLERAIFYLDRRGLIVRKEGAPHMIMFVED